MASSSFARHEFSFVVCVHNSNNKPGFIKLGSFYIYPIFEQSGGQVDDNEVLLVNR